jgi:hypothetical protein
MLRRLGGRVDLAVDEQPAGVRATGTGELPCHLVSLARELGPLGILRWVLFQPELAVLVREAAQAGVPEPVRPRLCVREDCRRSPHAFIVALPGSCRSHEQPGHLGRTLLRMDESRFICCSRGFP